MGSKLEDLLLRLGNPGQQQLLASFFLIFSFVHTITMNYCMSFVTMTPPHRCKLPDTWEWPNNMSIPHYNTSSGTIIFEECKIYKDPLNQSLGFEDCPGGESEFLYMDGERNSVITESESTSCYTLMLEMFPLKYRTKAGILTLSAPALSLAFANLLAYFITEWRYQLLGHSLAPLVSMIGIRYVKESFRWLLSQQKVHQALTTAQQVAKFNRIFLPKSLESDLTAIAEEIKSTRKSDKKQTVFDLLKQPFLRWICLIMCYNMFLAQISLYGFNFLISDIGGNAYVNFAIIAACDFVMRGTSYFTVEKIGRTMSTAISLLTVGSMNLIFTLAKTYQDQFASLIMLSLTVAIIGRIFNGQFFCAAFMQSSEIFPTTVRSTASGVLVGAGRFGLLLLPIILLMGDYVWKQMPFLVFGIGCIIGGMLSFFLPETQGLIIPNTVEEACGLRNRKLKSDRNGAPLQDMNVHAPMLEDDHLLTPPTGLIVTA